jgi:hypothetical protein
VWLLDHVLVCMAESVPALPQHLSLLQSSSQQEVSNAPILGSPTYDISASRYGGIE